LRSDPGIPASISILCPEGDTSRDAFEPSTSIIYMSNVLAADRAETITRTTAAIRINLIV
jgi:hypothetical protein